MATAGGRETRIWNHIVSQAYDHRINLSSQALYQAPGPREDTIEQFFVFTYSASCSEVEIDVLTGETVILRADLLYDAGKSLNPAADIGQIEGGFMMGVGNMLTEDLVFDKSGKLTTDNTWNYKIPGSKTIPAEFHVDSFPRDSAPEVPENPNLILSSKSIAEPPAILAASVYFAVKHAVLAARRDRGHHDWFEIQTPATGTRIRDACLMDAKDLII